VRSPEEARAQQQEPALPRQGRAAASSAAQAPAADLVPEETVARARAIGRRTGHALLKQVTAPGRPVELQPLNNALMDTFREHRSAEAYSLLFELNVRTFALFAAQVMRRMRCRADPHDVLQEAFLAIYRYPSRFRAEKPNAFRNWSYSIIRNTVLRHLHSDSREGIPAELLADMLPDTHTRGPIRATEDAESYKRCKRAWMLILCLYARAYEQELKPRDRRALELVEIEKLGYREAAEVLGIRLENFKMVVCRARKKIGQTLIRVLGSRLP
jgi:RNA polymerase sigma factor (sigma-70 family)